MKVIICRGIQGSGKTYWAKQWVNQNPVGRIRINNDDIRNMLGPYWIPSRERLVNKIRVFTIEEAMNNKYDVVVDNMNLSEKATREIIDIANKNNYDIEYRDFKTLLETCIDRDSKRENPIGAQVIHDTYNRHKDFYLDHLFIKVYNTKYSTYWDNFQAWVYNIDDPKFLDAITDICIKENKEFNINDDSETSTSWTYEIQSWAGRTDEDQYCLPIIYDERPK